MRRILGAATTSISLWLPWVAFGQTDALTKGVGELADKLAFSRKGDVEGKEGYRVYELRKKITRIAVTEFPFRDKFNALTRTVQDILSTTLIQKGITVVEREKLEEVLREQKAGTTGVIDLSTAAQMGKLLGVEAVVGSIADLGNSLGIIGRLVDVDQLDERASSISFTIALDQGRGKGARMFFPNINLKGP